MNCIRVTAADLTGNFLQKVLFYEFCKPSGFSDIGNVSMVTSDKKFYSMLMDKESCVYKYNELFQILPILKNYISGKPPYTSYDFQRKQHGWEYYYLGYGSNLLIKTEFYSCFLSDFSEAIKSKSDESYYRAYWEDIAIKALKRDDNKE